ncbi:MAG: substrate-binding domain-containing protein [bacterium]|nr:substrate-binding domain-containing protein [Candidatus Colisoma equi]
MNAVGCFQPLSLNNQKCLRYKPAVGLPDWIAALPKPAAIFAANDFVGEQVMSAASRLGLSVPDDVAVLGVDNDEEICLRATPTLSSIKPDHERAGYLAADLLRQLIRNPKQPPLPQSFGTLAVFHRASTRALRRHDEKAMRLVETIRRMATDTVTIPELAKEFGLAVRTVELRFKEATGHSIRDEIQSLRLERAKVLLSQPRIKMSEVAATSGYPSLLAFRKTFRRLTGVAPGKWRKNKRQDVGRNLDGL